MSGSAKQQKALKPLKVVACTSSDCDNDLHCFKKSRGMTPDKIGQCRSCGAELVDWERIHRRELLDASFTFEALQYEMVRHHYWHVPIDLRAENYARRKGKLQLKEAVRKRVTLSVGAAMPVRDGRQTPQLGSKNINIIHYAQHAVACCCRTCMEYWHGIPKGVELTEEQISYFVELIMLYVHARMPNLKDEPEKIPAVRKVAKGDVTNGTSKQFNERI